MCSVLFFMTRFSAEGSLPRIALPLEPGSEQGAPKGLAGLPSTHPPCPPPSTANLPRKEEGIETPRVSDVHEYYVWAQSAPWETLRSLIQ